MTLLTHPTHCGGGGEAFYLVGPLRANAANNDERGVGEGMREGTREGNRRCCLLCVEAWSHEGYCSDHDFVEFQRLISKLTFGSSFESNPSYSSRSTNGKKIIIEPLYLKST